MFFDKNNNYFKSDDYDIDKTNTLYSPSEGFNKGNMFSNLYSIYKNHNYMIKVNNEKDELLYKIQIYSFALKDYNLYLDIYPNDANILREFRDCKAALDDLKTKYQDKYGPLSIMGVNSTSKWTWINEPWPWDKGGR